MNLNTFQIIQFSKLLHYFNCLLTPVDLSFYFLLFILFCFLFFSSKAFLLGIWQVYLSSRCPLPSSSVTFLPRPILLETVLFFWRKSISIGLKSTGTGMGYCIAYRWHLNQRTIWNQCTRSVRRSLRVTFLKHIWLVWKNFCDFKNFYGSILALVYNI